MDQTDSGPVEFQWILQPERTFAFANRVSFSVWLTEMLVRPKQYRNASLPIAVTLLGIVMLVRREQSLKAELPIDVTLSGIVILVRPEQSENT